MAGSRSRPSQPNSSRDRGLDGPEIIILYLKERTEVPVIAGFSGINPRPGRITTLGRGGSDTSAVAISPHSRRTLDSTPRIDWRLPHTPPPAVVSESGAGWTVAFEECWNNWHRRRQGAAGPLRGNSAGAHMPVFRPFHFRQKPEDIDPHGTPGHADRREE